MNSRSASVLGFLFATIVLTPVFAFAQEETSAPEQAKNTLVTVTTKDRYTFESDVSRMSGQVSVNQYDFNLTYETKAFDKLPVNFWYDYKNLSIDENLPVDLPASLHGHRFGLGAKLPVPFLNTEEYFMGIDVMPSWYTDDSSFNSSAMRVPFRTYFIYKPSDTFVLIAGAQIDVNADTPIVPIIGFNYQPNDRLDIHLATSEPTISYKLDDHWKVFAEYDGNLDEYEVTRAGQEGVVFKVREATFGGGLKLSIDEWLDASFSTGLNMARRFSYRDNVGKVDADSAPYVKVRLSIKF